MNRRTYLDVVGTTASVLAIAGCVTTDEYQVGELRPGQSNGSSLVMTAAATEDCPDAVPDEITFRTEFSVWNPEEDETIDDGVEYEWGFMLSQ